MRHVKPILYALVIVMAIGFLAIPKTNPFRPVDSVLDRFSPVMTAFGQSATAPSSQVPATPSSLFGAAFTSFESTTAGTAVSMQIYKPAGNVNVSTTGGLNTMYVYWIQCINTSATAVGATLKDGTASAALVPCPANAAAPGVLSLNPPIRITPGVTPTLTATTAETTLYFMIGGYMDQR